MPNPHETENNIIDPYQWVKDMTPEELEMFYREETEVYMLMLLKYDILNKQLIREQEFYELIPKIVPVKIGDYIYYRRGHQNPADVLTLYRFPYFDL